MILFCLPIAMFCYMAVANRPYFRQLTGVLSGQLMLISAGALMVVGGLWLRRIVRLQY